MALYRGELPTGSQLHEPDRAIRTPGSKPNTVRRKGQCPLAVDGPLDLATGEVPERRLALVRVPMEFGNDERFSPMDDEDEEEEG